MRPSLPPRWREVTALFGGRFDPPHVGHREAVLGLFKHPGVRQVVIIPSASPPHKPAIASRDARYRMAEFCFSGITNVWMDSCELNRPVHRPSYTFDTLEELSSKYTQNRESIAFVVGSDQLGQLHTWYRFPELLKKSHWIVLERKVEKSVVGPWKNAGEVLKEWEGSGLIKPLTQRSDYSGSPCWQVAQSTSYLTVVQTEAPPYSSTQIREHIAHEGTVPDGLLLSEVFGYLKRNKLYGISNTS